MTDFRITFSKKGPLVFISHLDLSHTFVRAFNRAGIPLRYSSGFNPHPKLVFALPLSVGMAGENEMCDVGLVKDMDAEEFYNKISAVMPPHLVIKSVEPVGAKFRNVKDAEYIFTIRSVSGVCEQIKAFLSSDDITVTKKSKSGEKQINIKPQIYSFHAAEISEDTQLVIKADSAPDSYLNPEYAVRALQNAGIIPQDADITCTRTRINLS